MSRLALPLGRTQQLSGWKPLLAGHSPSLRGLSHAAYLASSTVVSTSLRYGSVPYASARLEQRFVCQHSQLVDREWKWDRTLFFASGCPEQCLTGSGGAEWKTVLHSEDSRRLCLESSNSDGGQDEKRSHFKYPRLRVWEWGSEVSWLISERALLCTEPRCIRTAAFWWAPECQAGNQHPPVPTAINLPKNLIKYLMSLTAEDEILCLILNWPTYLWDFLKCRIGFKR